MKKSLLIFFLILTLITSAACGGDPEPTPKEALQSTVEEYFDGNNLVEIDDVYPGDNTELHLTLNTPDAEAADVAIFMHSNNLAKKIDSETLTLIWALPKLANVCEVKYEKVNGALEQVSLEYDI